MLKPIAVVILIAGICGAISAQEQPATEPAAVTAMDFYSSIVPRLNNGSSAEHYAYIHGEKPDPERDEQIRRFFNGLGDASQQEKIEAIRIIDGVYVAAIPNHMVPELLAPMLEDPHLEVRIAAARAASYRRAANELADPLLRLLDVDNVEAKQAALRAASHLWQDPRSLPAVVAHLEAADPLVRVSAVEALASLSPQGLATHLDRMLKDEDWRVRRAAVVRSSHHQLLFMLDDPQPKVRQAAMGLLGQVAAPRDTGGTWRSTINRLHPFLDKPEDGAAAMTALAQMGDQGVLPLALDWLTGEDKAKRKAALDAVLMLEAESALPTLRTLQNHEETHFAEAVQWTIRRIESLHRQSPAEQANEADATARD